MEHFIKVPIIGEEADRIREITIAINGTFDSDKVNWWDDPVTGLNMVEQDKEYLTWIITNSN